jgi:hypothetical protein
VVVDEWFGDPIDLVEVIQHDLVLGARAIILKRMKNWRFDLGLV